MKIVFATNNAHKLEEIRSILGGEIEILSLRDIGCDVDIPETGSTLKENALQKARYVWEHYHLSCFADDTGLEVDALGGAPGVYSARYAAVRWTATMSQSTEPAPESHDSEANTAQSTEPAPESHDSEANTAQSTEPVPESHDSEANTTQLLKDLGENNNRKARFRTVIALILKKDVCPCGCTSIKQEHLFEGVVEGEIAHRKSGVGGFGYDPVFRPEGYDKTFAELGADIKNQISHRARATQKLCDFLRGR